MSDGPSIGAQPIILLVDDDSLLRPALTRFLAAGGYTVLDVASGAEAMAIIGDADQQLDLLITDVEMPGLTGVELLRLAREIRPDLAALVVTGYAEAMVGDRPPGVNVLVKPFRRPELLALVGGMLDARAGGA